MYVRMGRTTGQVVPVGIHLLKQYGRFSWVKSLVMVLLMLVSWEVPVQMFASKEPVLPEPPSVLSILEDIRLREVPYGSEVVLDFSRLPADLKVQDLPDGDLTVTFSGKVSRHLSTVEFSNDLLSVKNSLIETQPGKDSSELSTIVLRRKRPEWPVLYSFQNPGNLVLHVQHVENGHIATRNVVPGVQYIQLSRRMAFGPIRVNVIQVDPSVPGVEVRPVLAADKMGSREPVREMVARHQAIAGINGSFFKQDMGIPLGHLIIDEELIASSLFHRVTLGIAKDNTFRMGRFVVYGELTLPGGEVLTLDTINQPRIRPDQSVLYTAHWGAFSPEVPSGFVAVQLENHRVRAVSENRPLPIPEEGYVILGPKTSMLQALMELPPQKEVAVQFFSEPDWSEVRHAMGGGPYLLKEKEVFVDTKAEQFTFLQPNVRAPRSAVGITGSGQLLMVTVDGRQADSVGLTLYELALLMKELGAVEAMNLDGGGSTQMVVNQQLVNTPSTNSETRVSNGLVVNYHVPVQATASR